jgi:hypothetical protein
MERQHYRYHTVTRTVSNEDIWRLWRSQLDTAVIASRLQIPEYEVANRLPRIREQARREANSIRSSHACSSAPCPGSSPASMASP